jgi:hypothetical protein
MRLLNLSPENGKLSSCGYVVFCSEHEVLDRVQKVGIFKEKELALN